MSRGGLPEFRTVKSRKFLYSPYFADCFDKIVDVFSAPVIALIFHWNFLYFLPILIVRKFVFAACVFFTWDAVIVKVSAVYVCDIGDNHAKRPDLSCRSDRATNVSRIFNRDGVLKYDFPKRFSPPDAARAIQVKPGILTKMPRL